MDENRIKKVFITAEHQMGNDQDIDIGSTDVIVLLDDDRKYIASFFTYAFVEYIRNKNRMTGDFLNGKYFWGKNMVLIEECTPEVINPVIKHIIEEGEFNDVFRVL
jgi:hypothetical protein